MRLCSKLHQCSIHFLPDDFALQVPAINTAVASIASSSDNIQVIGLLQTKFLEYI